MLRGAPAVIQEERSLQFAKRVDVATASEQGAKGPGRMVRGVVFRLHEGVCGGACADDGWEEKVGGPSGGSIQDRSSLVFSPILP